ncbi:sensor histidine kinase [Marivirga arenosa]|uniref:Histidine kinase n=1 Tax=Marivirga arenosa TaxID=3059076 RepID=A0AA51ZXD0_9BACT|nr:histidine kinase [Marivirga sp. BKB1-2]WNB18528.1 histidine kinase [Marivirga sp. BKB1-2]
MFPKLDKLYSFSSVEELFNREKFSWMSGYFYFHLLILITGGLADTYRSSLKKNMELQKLNSNLELDMLKSQIEPHFLFNTLNNIYRLVIDNEKAANTVLKLSDLLRFTLYESNNKVIPISDEIQFLEDYIELEKIRHHDNVSISYDFSEVQNDNYKIAPLLFVNFIENAFKHGVHHTIENTFVLIILKQCNENLVFTISNKIPSTKRKTSKAGGIGLENVCRRLELLYPHKHELIVEKEKDIFTVNLKIQMI